MIIAHFYFGVSGAYFRRKFKDDIAEISFSVVTLMSNILNNPSISEIPRSTMLKDNFECIGIAFHIVRADKKVLKKVLRLK